jgi:hypothetical protein
VEQQSEFDRLWMALDGLTRQVSDLTLGLAKAARVTPDVAKTLAPSPDYRIAEPVRDAQWEDVTQHGVEAPAEGPCSCEESLALRRSLDSADAHVQELLRELAAMESALDGERRARKVAQLQAERLGARADSLVADG